MLELAHILLPGGPMRVAPFSHAVRAGDFLFVTGQMPTLPEDNTRCVEGDVAVQTRQVISNLQSVLAGSGALWEAAFPPGTLPARTTVGVTGLAL
jgi:enamine deaminase RidA (YjgF/YER057c/UK114 family)